TVLEVARIIVTIARSASAVPERNSLKNQKVGAKNSPPQWAGARTIRTVVLLCKTYFSYCAALFS
ncbi:hypothetical protein, partial [Microbulbifer sp. 2205BS26-8]|uniref:hypothetical protein n=1 Tax=Microbulbifer sp. 2205BS26-8 TaxID=3064386 RepID=UPI00273FC948